MNAVTQHVQHAVQTARQWSPYQLAIFDWVKNGKGNAIVRAVAGSGKSTTVEEAVRHSRGSSIVLAFNAAIAKAMKERGVNGRTFHSLCFTAVLRAKNAQDVTKDKPLQLMREHYGDNTQRLYGAFMRRMLGLARNAGIGAGLTANTVEEWTALARHHDVEPESERADFDEAIRLSMELLDYSNDSDMVDFDDVLYFAVKDGITLPKFDWVWVDEAQDTNQIQRAIIRKLMHSGTRLGFVGDESQAIYGFRGADADSMALIAREFACTDLPLTVTYRCAQAIVDYAKVWVDHIEAAPNAKPGVVDQLSQWDHTQFRAGDLVVCRNVKPVVALAYYLIGNRVAAHVMGRDIGEKLAKLVKKLNAKGIDALVDKLTEYTRCEVEKAMARGEEARAESLKDRRDCLLCIIDALMETDRTVPALLAEIDRLFSDAKDGVMLSSIHKSKGLEADRVFWLNPSLCPSKWARQDWQLTQEDNLCYVAVTRAKSELFMIEDTDMKKG